MNLMQNLFVGKIIKDPELKSPEGKKPYVNLSFPYEGLYNKVEEKPDTEWIDFPFFGDLAENVAQRLKKGDVVSIEYLLVQERVEVNGQTRKYYKPFVTNIKFISWGKSNVS